MKPQRVAANRQDRGGNVTIDGSEYVVSRPDPSRLFDLQDVRQRSRALRLGYLGIHVLLDVVIQAYNAGRLRPALRLGGQSSDPVPIGWKLEAPIIRRALRGPRRNVGACHEIIYFV